MLLIITNKKDLTSDYLILRLDELNIPYTRLNTEDYLLKYQIEIDLSNNSVNSSINFFNGDIVNIKDINGVFFKHTLKPNVSDEIPVDQRAFAERELIETMKSLFRLIDKKYWLNHPKYIYSANNKIEQLQFAANIGFNIPKTCISSDATTIHNFYNFNKGNLIAKAVKHGFYKSGKQVKVATTHKVEKNFIDNIGNYSNIPMILQEKIEKECDIRVTIVGNKVYAAAIHSQDYKETKTDWRLSDLYGIDLKYTKHNLPSKIIESCVKITDYFNLNYSAIDLIYTPKHEYYFLEMNPNGQWAWIEEKLGFPIRDSIIKFLGCFHGNK